MARLTLHFDETGEVRCPRKGEWFVTVNGEAKLAEHNYNYAEFSILRQVSKEDGK